MKILLIDDSRAIHAYVSDCLRGMDIHLTHAFDGVEGLDALARERGNFDLILLDWEMPRMDGPTTHSGIRQSPSRCPVIMMTSRNSVENITRMLTAGVSEYILKPFTRDIFLEKLSQALGRSLHDIAI